MNLPFDVSPLAADSITLEPGGSGIGTDACVPGSTGGESRGAVGVAADFGGTG